MNQPARDISPPQTRRAWLERGLHASLGHAFWRSGLAGAAALAGAAPEPARAGYNFWLSEYTVDKPELARQLQQHFPLQVRYAQLFSVRLSNPRLGLDAAANRASVTSDLQIDNPLILPTAVRGLLAISSRLRFDGQSRALRLEQPRAEQVRLDGLTGDGARQLQAVGEAVATQVLDGYALYTFTPEDLMYNGRALKPGDITVLDDGIKVKVELD